jgi:hypothetical protein
MRIPGLSGRRRSTLTDLELLPLGHDPVGAVHVQAEEVLDPVVGVGADAARLRALPMLHSTPP